MWGDIYSGKNWTFSCLFYFWLSCVPSGWHEQQGSLDYIELTPLLDTSRHTQAPPTFHWLSTLGCPAGSCLHIKLPWALQLQWHSSALAFNNSLVVSAFATKIHSAASATPTFWNSFLAALPSIHKAGTNLQGECEVDLLQECLSVLELATIVMFQ